MLGLNPLSSAPISDLGVLAPITGYINTTDNDDTCIIVSGGISSGYIDATDGTDTALINGSVAYPIISGNINTTDQNDTALLQGDVVAAFDTHDGFTPQEIRRAKELDKKIRKAEQKRIAAVKAQAARRRQRFIDSLYPDKKAPESFYNPENFDENGNFVAPKLLTKEQKAKLKTIKKKIEVAEPKVDYEAQIAQLKAEQNLIVESMLARMRLANLQMQLAIIEAQRQAELDDEEALLLLL